MANPHPEIKFQVNLELNREEKVGPLTNEKEVAVLHPTAYQSDPDNGREEKSNFKNTRSALLNDKKCSDSACSVWLSEMNLKHGDTFIKYGVEALEYRKKYVAGDWNDNVPTAGLGPILTIVT
jgi:hypothetical protein